METIKKFPLKDPIYISGCILIIVSLFTFLLPEIPDFINKNDSLGIFFFNYLLFLIYMFTLIINGFKKHKWWISQNNIEYTFLLLLLGLISCYSLNREMNLFSESTPWLCVYLSMLGSILILLAFKDYFPVILKHLFYFLFGASLVLCLYLALYLTPMYGMSAIIIFILGISGHTFVPLVIFIFSIIFIIRNYSTDKRMIPSFYAGLIIPIIILICFIYRWNSITNEITYTYNNSITKKVKLPNWVIVSQKLSNDWITDRVMKSGIVYSISSDHYKAFRSPFEGSGKGTIHDPFVICASFFCSTPHLDVSERIKIMKSVYDARHIAQDRLWSGESLHTNNVITNAEIYPETRIAYTEKIISIQNSIPENTRWRDTEEAIYTFHLPEGSVVTSLSLWINGIEEKASLTTKGKADTAYKTIVGIEQRDPSVIHWQEGNTVSVRVFPCTPKENRRFKIGITSPLRKSGNFLFYENIEFEGPEYDDATESMNIQFKSDPIDLKLPSFFKLNEKNYFTFDGNYNPSWEIKMNTKPISNNVFFFNNNSYSIEPLIKKYETFESKNFYLDINKSWTEEEVNALKVLAGQKKVYVYKDFMTRLTEENFERTIKELRELKFSLFPIDKIKDPDHSLLISKSTEKSPNLHDLQGSSFLTDLNSINEKKIRIKLFNLGSTLSPYLKSLKEIRIFTFDQGSIEDLSALLKERKFLVNAEDNNTVIIDNAEIKIKKLNDTLAGKGPNHILRLYMYNDIMKKLNTNYLNKEFFSEELIQEAQIANIVSPVSSLIVLETAQDYERFGIERTDKNASLHNASSGSFGSVPEPHEWLLIILSIGVVSFFFGKSYFEKRFLA